MLLGGLWHGEALHFVLWGVYHGALLVAHRIWCSVVQSSTNFARLRETSFYQIMATLYFSCRLRRLGLVPSRQLETGFDDSQKNSFP